MPKLLFINTSSWPMLLALLYHKIGKGKYANPLPLFEEHLKWISKHYQTLLPGEKLPSKLSVCLTFDDAFFDFYHYIFPLLQKYNLKALLSVPTAFIPNSATLSAKERLKKVATFSDNSPPLPSPAFCTWDELRELNASPLIEIASHSVNHRPLSEVDPEHELITSKKNLETNLSTPIQTFVYPYGRFTPEVHALATQHYKCVMRIGNALNRNWTNTNGLFYRVNADRLPHYRYPFSFPQHIRHSANYLLNALRKR